MCVQSDGSIYLLQFEDAFLAKRLRNWEASNRQSRRPRGAEARAPAASSLADIRGRLLCPPVSLPSPPPPPHLTAWDYPLRITQQTGFLIL